MNAKAFYHQLSELGVRLFLDDGKLNYTAPKGVINQSLLTELKANKADLMALLQQQAKHTEQFATINPADPTLPVPLSYAQQRLWIIEQIDSGRSDYNISLALQLRGQLNQAALEQAFAQVVERHEVLRCGFSESSQQLQTSVPFALTFADLTADAQQQQTLNTRLPQDANRPFDLTTAPLLRVFIYQLAPDKWVMMVVMHHIISDGWSIGVLVNEVTEYYCAALEQRQPQLADLAIGYGDYAHWQRLWLTGDYLETQLAYWQQRLADIPKVHGLPLDRMRGAQQITVGDQLQSEISVELTTQLRNLSLAQHSSLFIVLQTAFAVLLARWSREQDIVVATPVANRIHPSLEPLIGFFVNTLVLRTQVDGDVLFADLLKHNNRQILTDFSHQNVPFEMLVERLNPPRDLSHSAIFQIMFALQDSSDLALTLPGVEATPLDIDSGVAMFDLNVQVHNKKDHLVMGWGYNSDLFDRSTIDHLSASFTVLLEGICANINCPVARLPLVNTTQRQWLVNELNHTDKTFASQLCMHQLIEQQVLRQPNAVALRFEQQSLSFDQFNRRANQLAAFLVSQGIGPDDFVGLCMERSLELVIAIVAIHKAGGAYVPLDGEYPEARLRYIVEDAGIKLVLSQRHLSQAIDLNPAKVFCLDDQQFAEQLKALSENNSQENPDITTVGVKAHHLAYMIYTSGSTGQPKGVMIEHQALVNRLSWMQNQYPLNDQDVVLQKTPFSFDVSVWELLWSLMVGAQMVLAKPSGHKDPMYLQKLIMAQGVTTLHFVPSMLSVLLESVSWQQCEGVKRVFCSGEALPGELQQRFFSTGTKAALINLYGPTEAAIDVSYWDCQADDLNANVPIGKPIDNIQLYVLDDQLQLLPPGAVGELAIGGVGLARGYINRAELTANTFVQINAKGNDDGLPSPRLYKTGDLARWSSQGQLEYLGRTDFQVKLRGFRIELGEIESAISTHGQVNAVSVLVRDELLIAYLVLADSSQNDGSALTTELIAELITELKTRLSERLPAFMLPDAWLTIDTMPVTANGKLDRRALPMPDFSKNRSPDEASGDVERFVAPPSQQAQKVAQLWCEVLQLERVSMRDNFFDLGGNSLKLIHLARALNQHFECEFSPLQLFQYPTIEAFLPLLNQQSLDQDSLDQDSNESAELDPLQAKPHQKRHQDNDDIAIVGMAGRFPGADSVADFWQNLVDGEEGISFFSDEELLAEGISQQVLDTQGYVKANSLLNDPYGFDAALLGYPSHEAELLDPQLRHLHECAWTALENGGYNGDNGQLRIGLYSGATDNLMWLQKMFQQVNNDPSALFDAMSLLKRDYFNARVAYKLNLTGPAMSVQTACSTSLVAVHMAAQAILNGDCDLALAGGVSVQPKKEGYFYQQGMIGSPDGHCRAFDAQAQGTVGGEGVGLVLLKRRVDAEADGDQILAVIKGTAVNNDGSNRMGFTAPGVAGQAQAIKAAQAMAGVNPESVSYIECHGTGTVLGDPIEIEALNQVFASSTAEHCYLGAVKTNIGHLDTAAGAAGLIKTVMSLRHRTLPATLHFNQGNPNIDWANNPFEVVAKTQPWVADDDQPLTAGVSSFGIGGHNTHVVVQEYQDKRLSGTSRQWQLLLQTGKSEAVISRLGEDLAEFIRETAPDTAQLADISFTLQTGRRHLEYRQVALCCDSQQALAVLEGEQPQSLLQGWVADKPPVTFMFSGQGSQYAGMAADLYRDEAVFRQAADTCLAILAEHLTLDMADLLFADNTDNAATNQLLAQTEITQPALFTIEYAMAKQLMYWGIEPDVMIGHSLGEYVAATLAGVFSLADALMLVVNRGRLMASVPPGSMLSVPLPLAELNSRLASLVAVSPQFADLSVAADNSSELTVVSGQTPLVTAFAEQLSTQQLNNEQIKTTLLRTSHAYHSEMMTPIIDEFRAIVQSVSLNAPKRTFISNVSGQWAKAEEVTTAEYWCQHLRGTVNFKAGAQLLLADKQRLFIEVGPGRSLCSFIGRHAEVKPEHVVCHAIRHPKETRDDAAHTAWLVARLYVAGANIHWSRYRQGEQRLRVGLPSYPFEHQQFEADSEVAIVADDDQKSMNSHYHARPNLATAFVKPQSAHEQRLAQVWCDLFRLQRIGLHDDFFALGGNSLMATRMLSQLHQQGFNSVTLEQLFNHTTIAELAGVANDQVSETTAAAGIKPSDPADGDKAAVSFMQQRLWLFEQFAEGNAAYHIPLVIEFAGRLNIDALQQAFNTIVQRHEILRTVYDTHMGQPVPRLLATDKLPLQPLDFSAEPQQQVIEQQVSQCFDLTSDLMIRAALGALTSDRHLLVITIHHIAFDGWSAGVLITELEALYRAYDAGNDSPLPPLEIQYADYAHWQNGFVDSDAFAAQVDYWLMHLQNVPELHNLPLSQQRGVEQTFAMQRYVQVLDANLTGAMAQLNLAQGATLFMLLQGALALTFARWSNVDDVVMGSPIANRTQVQTEPLIGAFINTLVLRTQIDFELSFADFLAGVKGNLLQAYANQDVPFELLLDKLNVQKNDQYNPLYQVLFALQNNQNPQVSLPDLTLSMIETDASQDVFDISINAYEVDDEIHLLWDYNMGLFTPDLMDNIGQSLTCILKAVVADSRIRLADIAMTGQRLADKVVINSLPALPTQTRTLTVSQRFAGQLENNPNALALQFGAQSLTYQQLAQQVHQCSAGMREQGVTAGDAVAVYLDRSVDMVVAILATLHCGAMFIPLDPAYPITRVTSILDQVAVKVVLTSSVHGDKLKSLALNLLRLDALPTDGSDLNDFSSDFSNQFGNQFGNDCAADLAQSAYVIFTSGSTGAPKGVEIGHRALSEFISSMIERIELTRHCKWLAVTTISFDISILELLAPLTLGGCVVLADDQQTGDAMALMRMMAYYNVNILQATPATWKMLLLAGWQGRPELTALCGGEALPLQLIDDLRPLVARLFNCYGPTEATIWCLVKEIGLDDGVNRQAIGRPLANTGYLILDAQCQLVPDGVAGQLFITGQTLANGYWQRDDLTAEKFITLPSGHQAYATGDLVRQLVGERGADKHQAPALAFLGRMDHQVKIRGHRIELEEIEQAILQLDSVAETTVIVAPDSAGEPLLAAYILATEGVPESQLMTQLRRHLPMVLPLYMMPGAWVKVDHWPLTLNGKIDRKALPAPDFNLQTSEFIAPINALQNQLVDLCQTVLQQPKVSMGANFFELGGNSLNATHFVALLCQTFTVDISIRAFLALPDLLALADWIEQHQTQQSRAEKLLGTSYGNSDDNSYDDNDDTQGLEEFEL